MASIIGLIIVFIGALVSYYIDSPTASFVIGAWTVVIATKVELIIERRK